MKICKWWTDESKEFDSPLTILNLNGEELSEEINISIERDNKTIWIGEKIRDEEVTMIDAILKRYSTLTILDISCDDEKKLR